MKPTRIIKEPYYVQAGRCKYKMCECDNGKIYSVQDLATEIGTTRQYMAWKISRGWWRQDVLIIEKRITKEVEPIEDYDTQESPYKRWSPGDLAHLSATHNRYGEYVGVSP